jgi:hypothetical protein
MTPHEEARLFAELCLGLSPEDALEKLSSYGVIWIRSIYIDGNPQIHVPSMDDTMVEVDVVQDRIVKVYPNFNR